MVTLLFVVIFQNIKLLTYVNMFFNYTVYYKYTR